MAGTFFNGVKCQKPFKARYNYKMLYFTTRAQIIFIEIMKIKQTFKTKTVFAFKM